MLTGKGRIQVYIRTLGTHQSPINRRFDLGLASGRFDLITIEIVDISASFCMSLSIFQGERNMYSNIQYTARLRIALPEPRKIRIFCTLLLLFLQIPRDYQLRPEVLLQVGLLLQATDPSYLGSRAVSRDKPG